MSQQLTHTVHSFFPYFFLMNGITKGEQNLQKKKEKITNKKNSSSSSRNSKTDHDCKLITSILRLSMMDSFN